MPTLREQIEAEARASATSLPSVLAKYAREGFTEDDLDYQVDFAKERVAKRKKEKAQPGAVDLPGAAGETTSVKEPSVATTEWHPIDKLAGAAKGLAEGAKEQFYDPSNLSAGLAKMLGVKGWKAGPSPIQIAAQEEKARKEKLVAEKPFIERLGQDVGNVVTAIPALAYATVGPTVVPPGQEGSEVARQEGEAFGKTLPKALGGAMVQSYDITELPINLAAEPLSTAMDWIPLAGAGAKAVKAGALATKIPAAAKAVGAVETAVEATKALPSKAVTGAVGAGQDVALAAAERLGLDKTGEWLKSGNLATRAQRFLSDPSAHPDERVRAFTQDLAMEPRRVEGSISKRGEAIAETPATRAVPPVDTAPERTFGKVTETPGGKELEAQQARLEAEAAKAALESERLKGVATGAEGIPTRLVARTKEARAALKEAEAQAARSATPAMTPEVAKARQVLDDMLQLQKIDAETKEATAAIMAEYGNLGPRPALTKRKLTWEDMVQGKKQKDIDVEGKAARDEWDRKVAERAQRVQEVSAQGKAKRPWDGTSSEAEQRYNQALQTLGIQGPDYWADADIPFLEDALAKTAVVPPDPKVAQQAQVLVADARAKLAKAVEAGRAYKRQQENLRAESATKASSLEADVARQREQAAELARQRESLPTVQTIGLSERTATPAATDLDRAIAGYASPEILDVAREAQKAFPQDPQKPLAVLQTTLAEFAKLASDPLTIRELIRDERFRKVFQKEADLSDAQIKVLQGDILDPTTIGLGPEYRQAFETALAASGKAQDVRKRVLAATVATLADDASKAVKKRMLDGEAQRLVPPEGGIAWSPETAARKYMADLAGGDMPVQALQQAQNPTALARVLQAKADEGGPQTKMLAAEAKRLRTFKQLDKELVGADHWVDPLLYEALTAEANAQKFMRGGSTWAWLASQMKANLTARNPKSALNNMIANSMMQVIRRGDPFGGVVEMVNALKFDAKKNPAKWDALERTGLFDSNILKQELKLGKSLPWNKLMEDFYSAGDKWFKAGEAHRAYDELDTALKALRPGESIKVEIAPGRVVTVQARSGKDFQGLEVLADDTEYGPHLTVTDSGKTTVLRNPEDLVAKAAATRANAMFFDYGDVPGLVRWVRSQPALGIMTPFFTYASKAIDLPGKPGLGTQIIKGSQGWFDSTSPSVLAKQAAWQAAEGVRRHVVLNMGKQQLLDRQNEDMVRAVQYMPNEMKPTFVAGLSSPGHLAIASMGNWNVLDPTLTAARLASQLLVDKGALPRKAEDPKAARLLYLAETGQLGSAADALSLVGMGGSAITDFLAKVQDAEKPGGKPLSAGAVLQSFGPALLGGGVATGIDLTIGGLDEDSPYTSRMSGISTKDPQVVEDLVRWMIRKTTGIGWRALKVYDDRGFDALGKKWKDSLGLKGRKIKAEKLINDAKATNDAEQKKQGFAELKAVRKLDNLVDTEMQKYKHEWLRVYRTVYGGRNKALRDR